MWLAWVTQVPNTTDPLAPFGLVTLAPTGCEVGNDLGTFRWSQTGSYGVVPNEAMPNCFAAQGFVACLASMLVNAMCRCINSNVHVLFVSALFCSVLFSLTFECIPHGTSRPDLHYDWSAAESKIVKVFVALTNSTSELGQRSCP